MFDFFVYMYRYLLVLSGVPRFGPPVGNNKGAGGQKGPKKAFFHEKKADEHFCTSHH